MSEHRAATKMQLFPRCPRAGRRKPLLASCASPPCRDELVLTRQSWSYPLTSCVSLNCSTLQIHLQSQLQLSEVLFHLKQPTAVQAHLPLAHPLRKPTVPVPAPRGWRGRDNTAQPPGEHRHLHCIPTPLWLQPFGAGSPGTQDKMGTLVTAVSARAHSITPSIVLEQKPNQGLRAPFPAWPLVYFAWMIPTGHLTSAAGPPIPDPVPKVPSPQAQISQELPAIASKQQSSRTYKLPVGGWQSCCSAPTPRP